MLFVLRSALSPQKDYHLLPVGFAEREIIQPPESLEALLQQLVQATEEEIEQEDKLHRDIQQAM